MRRRMLLTDQACVMDSLNMILMAKSETGTIEGRHVLINSGRQSVSPSIKDFAISIKYDEEPSDNPRQNFRYAGG
jgi:hypothetical protein